jgi:bla regulator protein blaR1
MFVMLQHLLADRFKLVIHKEQMERPVYALVVANSRLGPGLRKSTARCEPPGTAAQGRDVTSPSDARANQAAPCGLRHFPGTLNATGITLAQLTTVLAQLRDVERTVVDQTNLDGAYDVDLTWKPEQLLPERLSPPPGAPPMPSIDPNGPSLFTALQEQLGLKLSSMRSPIEVVVVDRAEPPTED